MRQLHKRDCGRKLLRGERETGIQTERGGGGEKEREGGREGGRDFRVTGIAVAMNIYVVI